MQQNKKFNKFAVRVLCSFLLLLLACSPKTTMDNQDLPEHLKVWRGLYERKGDIIEDASPEDVEVAKAYPFFADKGEWQDAVRITIITAKTSYRTGEEIRIIHVVESKKKAVNC